MTKKVFVIGMGEVGRRLGGALHSQGVEVVEVRRDANWDRATSDEDGVRLVCVREGAVAEILDKLAGQPAERLAFVQNGWMRPQLEHLGEVTRGLIWFTSKGDFYKVLRPSPFGGPQADFLAETVSAAGIACDGVSKADFDWLEADKMGFNCVVGLPLAVHGCDLASYFSDHGEEAEAAFTEAIDICSTALGVPVRPGAYQAFVESCEPLGWMATSSAKALEWRNGGVVRLGRSLGIDAPANTRLLEAVGFEI